MRSVLALAIVLLLVSLTASFIVAARVIRRNYRQRFEQIRLRLEREAEAIVRQLFRRS